MADSMDKPPHPAREMTAGEAAEAARLLAEAYSSDSPVATRHRDITPVPRTGDAVPVTQPGRPPMSQKATDHAALVITYSLCSMPVSGALSLALYTLGQVDPLTLGIAAAAPVALAGVLGVAARMIGGAVRDGASAMPGDTHHHYGGPVHVQHNEMHTESKWFGKTTTRLDGKP